jgi:hypothetical protein
MHYQDNVIPDRSAHPTEALTTPKTIARSTRKYSNNHHATKIASIGSKLGGARGEDTARNFRYK